MDNLESKVGVVTGAASGIGLGIARAFGAEGMRLVLSDVSEDQLNRAVVDLRTQGADCIGRLADVRSETEVNALADAAVEAYGHVNVLCNNAGVAVVGRQWELGAADWAWAIDTCLWGVINGIRAFVPRMLDSGIACHVVNVASMGGLLAAPFVGPYACAKHAVVGLTKALRAELGGTNVGVTLVCPGNVRTNVVRAARVGRGSGGSDVDGDVGAFVGFLQTSVEGENSMEPEDVGKMVAQAIKTGQFWLLPNGESQLPFVEADFNEMRTASFSSGIE
ncbi:SDR family NAD(P)-dependent oxidoreductase [Mycobacterium terramassiliense]|uniref:NADP-dependent 3-hydroxy acid dehydrogenase YdfG n=1 Tax=Mycobacterium terramassiliense TaxID=1841859 RepID=A0A2U3NGE4_9MYCO|nr:SDR family NAD(P)-dependent oxidoreductase [Mycobacterium terramassiliense]SPM30577.1 NADP-dependent 3-hydroxy acid dehydrogenase YdfG [Mycobacterium terramassiliense]